MKALKLGLVGADFANFDARRLGVYNTARTALASLGEQMGFEVVAVPDAVQSQEEAAVAARTVEEAHVDLLLVQCSSFSLGDLVVPLAAVPTKLGLWFLPEPSFEGQIPLNSFTGFNLFVSIIRTHLGQPHRPVKWFYGNPGDPMFVRRLDVTVAALRGLSGLAGARIALLGAPAPTFLNLEFDAAALKQRLGVEVEQAPLDEVFRRAQLLDRGEVERTATHIAGRARRAETERSWIDATARVSVATNQIAAEAGCAAVALRCWPEFQEHMGGLGPCAAVAWLNETGLPTSCEGDVMAAVSMLAASHVSRAPATLADLVAVDPDTDAALLWHCGPTAPTWADERGQALIYHPTLDRSKPADAPRSGLSSDLVYAPGPVTVARFSASAASLFLLSGEIVPGPGPAYAGSRGWLGKMRMGNLSLSVFDLIETIAHYGLEHHYPLARGDWSAAFAELAAWAGIGELDAVPYRDYLAGARQGFEGR